MNDDERSRLEALAAKLHDAIMATDLDDYAPRRVVYDALAALENAINPPDADPPTKVDAIRIWEDEVLGMHRAWIRAENAITALEHERRAHRISLRAAITRGRLQCAEGDVVIDRAQFLRDAFDMARDVAMGDRIDARIAAQRENVRAFAAQIGKLLERIPAGARHEDDE